MSGDAPRTELPLLTNRQARSVIAASAGLILLIQAVLLACIGNGLMPGFMGDRYTEANVVRSADYFVHFGFAKTAGLPNILWSDRFPNDGTKGMPESLGTDNGVYLHYPPAPDLIAAMMARLVGMDAIWLWRLPCIMLNIVAMIILARVLIRVMGIDRAAILIAALAVTPMIWTYMNGLHFQGYASALWLMQFAVLLQAYWIRGGLSRFQIGLHALLGFGQGWLSFDFVFVVVLLALPLWLMRRTEGVTLDRRSLLWGIIAPLVGFCIAHLMHLIQVVIYFGGVRRAIDDYTHIAVYRSHDVEGSSYFVWLARACFNYAFRTAGPNVHFLVWFPIVTALAMLVILSRRVQFQFGRNARTVWIWQVPPSYVAALIAALAVGGLWLLLMPQHATVHYHFVGRHLFPFYFCCLFMLVRCLTRHPLEPTSDNPPTDPPLTRETLANQR